MNDSSEQKYIPGICNIGEAEIQERYRVGWLGLIVTVVAWVVFWFYKFEAGWFLLLALPAAMSATGFIQAITHFCAGFGIKGVFNFSAEAGKTDTVAQAEYRAKDRKKAIWILVWSALIGVAVALVAFFVK